MQIKIKLEDSKLVGIDIYELEDSSLETTLAAILGTYTPSLSTRDGANSEQVLVPAPITVDDFNHIRPDESQSRANAIPDLSELTDEDWQEHLETFQFTGDADALVSWLEEVFFSNSGPNVNRHVFRRARSAFDLLNSYPEVTRRLSLERWILLTRALAVTGAVNGICSTTATTYYNRGRRLTN